jgi:protein pelota
LRYRVLLKATHQLRVVDETETMEEVMKWLGRGEGTVTHGAEAVENAVEMGVVERPVLADIAIRDADAEQRLNLEEPMRESEKRGVKVTAISTEHEAGAKLLSLGGIVAFLGFPLFRVSKAQ